MPPMLPSRNQGTIISAFCSPTRTAMGMARMSKPSPCSTTRIFQRSNCGGGLLKFSNSTRSMNMALAFHQFDGVDEHVLREICLGRDFQLANVFAMENHIAQRHIQRQSRVGDGLQPLHREILEFAHTTTAAGGGGRHVDAKTGGWF